jgi:hypothetical protein
LIPEVALVELPPKKSEEKACQPGKENYRAISRISSTGHRGGECAGRLTLLVQNQDITPIQVDGMSGTKAGHLRSIKMVRWEENSKQGIKRSSRPPPTTITLGAIAGACREGND